MSFTKVAPAGIGTEPGTSILIGDSLLHSTGIDIGSNTGIGVTIRKHGDATFTGIVTASAFFGDGSGLEGVSSSGIGTPLSDDDTSDLNKVYYVNQELSIGSTVTVNHPSSAVASYTHYQDLVVTDDADFIVSDGDTFIPDVLGIRTSTSTASAATGGRIRAGTITNAGANGAPNFPNGLTGTAGTFTGNLNVAGVLTYEDVTNVDSVGVVTARAGVNLVGNDLNVGSNIKIGNASGIVTATSFSGDGSSLTGVGASFGNSSINTSGIITATSFVGNGAGLTNVSAGKVLQIKHAIKTDTQDFGSIGQGAETAIPFVASITPSSASNKILVQMMITMDMNTTHGTFATAKKTTGGTTTEPAIGDAASNRHRVTTGTNDNATSTLRNIHILFVDTAGTTNQIDYGFTLSHNDNNPVTIYLNYHGGDSDYSYNGRGVSSIVVTEFEP